MHIAVLIRTARILRLVAMIGIAMAVGAMTSCRGETTGFAEVRTITIELDAFSGLPNPTWTITGSEAADVNRRLQALSAAPARLDPGHLGYRGFILTSPEEPGVSFRVFDGIVTRMRDTGAAEYFSDRSGLEEVLKSQATRQGHGGAVTR